MGWGEDCDIGQEENCPEFRTDEVPKTGLCEDCQKMTPPDSLASDSPEDLEQEQEQAQENEEQEAETGSEQ